MDHLLAAFFVLSALSAWALIALCIAAGRRE